MITKETRRDKVRRREERMTRGREEGKTRLDEGVKG
jgi:hypothetical protein